MQVPSLYSGYKAVSDITELLRIPANSRCKRKFNHILYIIFYNTNLLLKNRDESGGRHL